MTDNLDQRVSLFGELKAESFYARTDAEALAKAQAHIADGGFIPTAPQMVRDRINQEPSDMVWMKSYTTMTQEYQGQAGGKGALLVMHDETGVLTPQSLSNAAQGYAYVKQAYDAKIEAEQDYDKRKALRAEKFAKLENIMFAQSLRIGDDVIDSIIANAAQDQIKVIPIEQYLTMKAVPYKHAILFEMGEKAVTEPSVDLPPELARLSKKSAPVAKEKVYGLKVNGQVYVPELIQSLEQAAKDPLFIARADGKDNAEGILKRLDSMGQKLVGNWHHLRDYKPTHPLGYMLQVGDQGLSHGFCPQHIGTDARFIAIRMTPEIEAVARRTYFDIGAANGNGNGKRKTPPEGMPALMTPAPQRPAAPEEMRDSRETIGPGEIEVILTAPPLPIPLPRTRKITAGLPPPPPKGNGTKI
jgi:hypothetical protein